MIDHEHKICCFQLEYDISYEVNGVKTDLNYDFDYEEITKDLLGEMYWEQISALHAALGAFFQSGIKK